MLEEIENRDKIKKGSCKMKKHRACRRTALLMALAGAAFVGYVMHHPEVSFPWNPKITNLFYIGYISAFLLLLAASLRKE